MAGNGKGLFELLATAPGIGETFPIQGPPEPEHLKIRRLEREVEELHRRLMLSLKSPELEFLTDDEFIERLKLLANRSNIEFSPNRSFIPLLLASCLPEMKEFKRPRGRIKAKKPRDYERYRAVRRYRMENASDRNCDDITAIRSLVETSHPLFAGRYSEETLSVSVSKGKRIFESFAGRANRMAEIVEALMAKQQPTNP